MTRFASTPRISAAWPIAGDGLRRDSGESAELPTEVKGPGVAKVNFLAKWAVSFSHNGTMIRNGASFVLFSLGEMGHRTILLRLSAVLRNALVLHGNFISH
jgi:hypothetical protein